MLQVHYDNQSFRKIKIIGLLRIFKQDTWCNWPSTSQIILWLKETGITTFHLGDVIRRRATFNLREVLKEYDGQDGSTRVLGLMPLGAGFTILAIGLLISTMVFIYELRQAAGTRPIHEVFREVREKRAMYRTASIREEIQRRNRARVVRFGQPETLDFHSISESARYRANVNHTSE